MSRFAWVLLWQVGASCASCPTAQISFSPVFYLLCDWLDWGFCGCSRCYLFFTFLPCLLIYVFAHRISWFVLGMSVLCVKVLSMIVIIFVCVILCWLSLFTCSCCSYSYIALLCLFLVSILCDDVSRSGYVVMISMLGLGDYASCCFCLFLHILVFLVVVCFLHRSILFGLLMVVTSNGQFTPNGGAKLLSFGGRRKENSLWPLKRWGKFGGSCETLLEGSTKPGTLECAGGISPKRANSFVTESVWVVHVVAVVNVFCPMLGTLWCAAHSASKGPLNDKGILM